MALDDVRLWSGFFSTKTAADALLEEHLAELDEWRRRFRRAVPLAEVQELATWGVLRWNYHATEDYTIVAAIAIAALNRPDRNPEQVLRLLEHEGTSHGLLLEAKVCKSA